MKIKFIEPTGWRIGAAVLASGAAGVCVLGMGFPVLGHVADVVIFAVIGFFQLEQNSSSGSISKL